MTTHDIYKERLEYLLRMLDSITVFSNQHWQERQIIQQMITSMLKWKGIPLTAHDMETANTIYKQIKSHPNYQRNEQIKSQ